MFAKLFFVCSSEELIGQISRWITYYIIHLYHEAIDNVTPADKYFGRDKKILYLREITNKGQCSSEEK